MRFDDERYVRVYSRDTTNWLMFSWDAQCLLPLIIRKLDRAGVLELGRHGLKGLMAHLPKMPAERWPAYEAALEELIANGVLEFREGFLIMPNYIAAQESKQTDAARQRAHRERDRDIARHGHLIPSQDVTDGHAISSQNVTKPSQPVTASHSVPSVPAVPAVPSVVRLSGTALQDYCEQRGAWPWFGFSILSCDGRRCARSSMALTSGVPVTAPSRAAALLWKFSRGTSSSNAERLPPRPKRRGFRLGEPMNAKKQACIDTLSLFAISEVAQVVAECEDEGVSAAYRRLMAELVRVRDAEPVK